jgi:predicted AAA+ superfamily ATPase
VTFFDLEDPRDQVRLTEPMLALEGLSGLVVLDEIQLRPNLFPVLRVLADRPRKPARFHSFDLAPRVRCVAAVALSKEIAP